jgi:hypothetical protein
MNNSIDLEKEDEILTRLRKENPNIGMMSLRKYFRMLGSKTDEETLKKVVHNADPSNHIGIMVDRWRR